MPYFHSNIFYKIFQKQDQTQFEKRWPTMQPISLKLLRQEPVTKAEWQDLFWYRYKCSSYIE